MVIALLVTSDTWPIITLGKLLTSEMTLVLLLDELLPHAHNASEIADKEMSLTVLLISELFIAYS
jgi:hypothetical protein